MGGWRCTYRNCTVKGDGVTHMFHYPVFDKIRCHQWLVNARRLDFLNLKLSQLKNRCVCQHHFKDDDFMNYMKDKIKCKAVPTEDGPYCDYSLESSAGVKSDELDYTIIFEDDIANDSLTLEEKRAHYPKKYSDFLSSDLSEMHQTSFDYNTIIQKSKKSTGYNQAIHANKTINYPLALNINPTTCNTAISEKVSTPVEVIKLEPTSKTSKNCIGQVFPVSIEFPIKKDITYPQHIAKENVEMNENQNIQSTPMSQNVHVRPKVQIVSQKTISKPFKVSGKLEPISPSILLTPRYLRNRNNHTRIEDNSLVTSKDSNENNKLFLEANETKSLPEVSEELFQKELSDSKKEEVFESCELTKEVKIEDSAIKNICPGSILQSRNRLSFEETPTVLPIKTKIPRERLAAIEEKRKFNMKLRNVMESHLSESKTNVEQHVSDAGVVTESMSNFKRKSLTLKGGSVLAKHPQLPSVGTYGIAYMEARMKRMEETLLNKIDQNTQSILGVKKLLLESETKKTSISTQTHCRTSYKKYLYEELSKYLSPNAKTIVYDELFISKHVQDIPTKRRKLSKQSAPS